MAIPATTPIAATATATLIPAVAAAAVATTVIAALNKNAQPNPFNIRRKNSILVLRKSSREPASPRSLARLSMSRIGVKTLFAKFDILFFALLNLVFIRPTKPAT